MKKIYSLIVTIASVWLVAIWFIGQETEKLLSAQQESGVELLEYENGFFGGTARFKVVQKFGVPQIDGLLANAIIDANYKHGPLTFSQFGFHIGSSLWQIRVNEQSLPRETQRIFNQLFEKGESIKGEIAFHFNENTDIRLNVPEIILSEFHHKIGQVEPSTIKARLNRLSLQADINASIGELQIQHPDGDLRIPVMNVQALLEDYLAQIPQGEIQVTLHDLHFSSPKLTEDIYLNLLADFGQQVNEDDLQGNLTVQVTEAETPFQMIQSMTANVKYTGLDREIFGAELFNTTSFSQVLLQSLKEQSSRVDLALLVKGSEGKAELDANAVFAEKSDNPLRAFNANLDFAVDQIYLDQSPLSLMLFHFIETGVIQKADDKYTFVMDMKHGNVDFNGKKVKVDKINSFLGAVYSGTEKPQASKVGTPVRRM
ncbi:MAG: Unknown protein [uncultured Thiotrichaceae bacterium]|uniref:DUF945 domain-containing protein n=1 Tax=uncultured Thiotrichaceae bacterium TaxID=298394 RepID=A0A6S6SA47_9GAMM|nr:MAG: Unknown protein [uncultured Thiotrichaceae bacterium]